MRLFHSVKPYNKIILLDRVVHTIERHRMFTPGDRVAVAVSGGADSVCLLHVLLELAPRWNLTVSVVHVNHNLRGEASVTGGEFVRTLAAALELPFQSGLVSPPPTILEQSARRPQCVFPRPPRPRTKRASLSGHTRSARPTVLFRFLRGAGAAGLAAITVTATVSSAR
jgi:tRNA(Ile)-lysidine synthase